MEHGLEVPVGQRAVPTPLIRRPCAEAAAKFYVNARGKIVDDPGGRWLTYLPMVD